MRTISAFPAALLLAATALSLTACQETNHDIALVAGTLDRPLPADTAPASVLQAIQAATRFHEHDIMSDEQHDISVYSLDAVDVDSGEVATQGFGIVVLKGLTATTLPHIRNTRQPQARFDADTGELWLATSAMEGTGVQVQRLSRIRFLENDSAYVDLSVQPYEVQQALCRRLGYHIEGEQVTFYDGQQPIATATNTVTGMGGMDDEQPLWIGEQMQYDLSGNTPRLLITPGVNFTTGLVLTYDDMPTLTASITFSADGQLTIGELQACAP